MVKLASGAFALPHPPVAAYLVQDDDSQSARGLLLGAPGRMSGSWYWSSMRHRRDDDVPSIPETCVVSQSIRRACKRNVKARRIAGNQLHVCDAAIFVFWRVVTS